MRKRNSLLRERLKEGNAAVRIRADIRQGLSEKEIEERVREGLVNRVTETPAKTTGQIIFGNIFTLFNLLNFALALLVLFVGSYKNLLFIDIYILCDNKILTNLYALLIHYIAKKLSLTLASKFGFR